MLMACALALAAASTAGAQALRGSSTTAASPGVAEFKDPRTGQLWVPPAVGRDGRPIAGPDDATFDPKAQNVPARIYEQTVRGTPIDRVPLAAGTRLASIVMDNVSLQAVPGQRWRVVLYLANYSGNPLSPVIVCRFIIGVRAVWSTRAIVQEIGAGVRQGLVVQGPRPDVPIDLATCQVTAP
jgi:hypothetical protein